MHTGISDINQHRLTSFTIKLGGSFQLLFESGADSIRANSISRASHKFQSTQKYNLSLLSMLVC